MTTSPNLLRHLAALTTALAIAAGCSSAEHPAAPSPSTAVTVQTGGQPVVTTTAAPATTPTPTAVPATTLPSTTVAATTTVVVPSSLGPNQQTETVEEGRQLIATTATTALSPPFQSYPAMIDSALYAVLDGTIPSAEFFDAIGLQIPDGVVVAPYLVCLIALGEKCRADPTDYGRFMTECAGPTTEVFTNLVELDGRWAAAGTCVEAPDRAQVEAAEEDALSFVSEALGQYASPVVRAPTMDPLADAMSQAWASGLAVGEEDRAQLDARAEGVRRFGLQNGYVITIRSFNRPASDDEFLAGFRDGLAGDSWLVGARIVVGVGSAVHHGGLYVTVVYAG